MGYPAWPNTDITYRARGSQVECTKRTKYNKVKLSATGVGTDNKSAEHSAHLALMKKVSKRYELESS